MHKVSCPGLLSSPHTSASEQGGALSSLLPKAPAWAAGESLPKQSLSDLGLQLLPVPCSEQTWALPTRPGPAACRTCGFSPPRLHKSTQGAF